MAAAAEEVIYVSDIDDGGMDDGLALPPELGGHWCEASDAGGSVVRASADAAAGGRAWAACLAACPSCVRAYREAREDASEAWDGDAGADAAVARKSSAPRNANASAASSPKAYDDETPCVGDTPRWHGP